MLERIAFAFRDTPGALDHPEAKAVAVLLLIIDGDSRFYCASQRALWENLPLVLVAGFEVC